MDFSKISDEYNKQAKLADLSVEDLAKQFVESCTSRLRPESDVVARQINAMFFKVFADADPNFFVDAKEFNVGACFHTHFVKRHSLPNIIGKSTFFVYALDGDILSRYWNFISFDAFCKTMDPPNEVTTQFEGEFESSTKLTAEEKEQLEICQKHMGTISFNSPRIMDEILGKLLDPDRIYSRFIKRIPSPVFYQRVGHEFDSSWYLQTFFEGSENGISVRAYDDYQHYYFYGKPIIADFMDEVQDEIIVQLPDKLSDEFVEELIINKLKSDFENNRDEMRFTICEEDRGQGDSRDKYDLIKNGIRISVGDDPQIVLYIGTVTLTIDNKPLVFPLDFSLAYPISPWLSKHILSFLESEDYDQTYLIKPFNKIGSAIEKILESKGITVYDTTLYDSDSIVIRIKTPTTSLGD